MGSDGIIPAKINQGKHKNKKVHILTANLAHLLQVLLITKYPPAKQSISNPYRNNIPLHDLRDFPTHLGRIDQVKAK